jgi:small subunit ribosomal protein S21
MAKKVKVTTMAQVKDPKDMGLSVAVRGDKPHDFMKAMRKFKRKINDSGIIQEIRDRQFYEKPSEKRRKALKAAKRRQQRALEDQRNNF